MSRQYWRASDVWWMEWDEFVAYRNGKISKDELHERVDRRRAGREPVEPAGGSEQSPITRWCD